MIKTDSPVKYPIINKLISKKVSLDKKVNLKTMNPIKFIEEFSTEQSCKEHFRFQHEHE